VDTTPQAATTSARPDRRQGRMGTSSQATTGRVGRLAPCGRGGSYVPGVRDCSARVDRAVARRPPGRDVALRRPRQWRHGRRRRGTRERIRSPDRRRRGDRPRRRSLARPPDPRSAGWHVRGGPTRCSAAAGPGRRWRRRPPADEQPREGGLDGWSTFALPLCRGGRVVGSAADASSCRSRSLDAGSGHDRAR
jgi:hypothetical protein